MLMHHAFRESSPAVCTGDPVIGDWLKNMESEHCERPDSHVDFESTNYRIITTPAREWEITTKQDKSLADMRHDRRLPVIQELCREQRANLIEDEVVAIVLYTGPMVGRERAVMHTTAESIPRPGAIFATFFMHNILCACRALHLIVIMRRAVCAAPPRRRGSIRSTTPCCGFPGRSPSAAAGTFTRRLFTCWCRPSSSSRA